MTTTEQLWKRTAADYVVALDWSTDGRYLAAAIGDGAVEVIATANGELVTSFMAHPQGINAAAWQPGAHRLATCGQDREAQIWDGLQGVLQLRLPDAAHAVEHLAWKPDGSRLATGSGRRLAVWDANGKPVWDFAGHEGTVNDLCWSRREDRLVTAVNGGLRALAVGSANAKWALLGKLPFISLAWHPAEALVAACAYPQQLVLWSILGDSEAVMSKSVGQRTRQLAWSPSGRFLAADGTEEILLWRFRDGYPEHALPFALEGHLSIVTALDFHPRHDLLATGDSEGLALLSEPFPGAEPEKILYLLSPVSAIRWSPCGSRLAIGSADGQITCCSWNAADADAGPDTEDPQHDDIPS